MSNKEVYNYLKGIDCCNICCLRFLDGRKEDFTNPEPAIATVSFEFLLPIFCSPPKFNTNVNFFVF